MCEVATQLVYRGMRLLCSWRTALLQLDAVRLMYRTADDGSRRRVGAGGANSNWRGKGVG